MSFKTKEEHREFSKKHYQENKQHYLELQRARRSQRQLWILSIKEKSKCTTCGENHVACLEFHHRDPSEKEFCIHDMITRGYSQKAIEKEMSKCDILCSNCHRKLHYDLKDGPYRGKFDTTE